MPAAILCLRIYSLCRASGFAGGSPRNQLRGERLTQQSSQGESLLRLVTIASTVVAFPVAVLQGRPASAVAALLIAAVWIAAATIHVWRKRSPSGKHKYSWERWVMTGVSVISACALGTVNTLPAGRSWFTYEVLGISDPATSATAGTLTIGESPQPAGEAVPASGQPGRTYRVTLPVLNSRPDDEQLSRITLHIDWIWFVGCDAPTYQYALQSPLTVTRGGHAQGSILSQTGPASGFSVNAAGTLTLWCGTASLQLAFAPQALILQGHSTTVISIDLPAQLKLTSAPGPDHMPPSTFSPRQPANVIVTLTAATRTGAKLSACGESDSQAGTRQALTSCPRTPAGP
jgi:hypothetical protein